MRIRAITGLAVGLLLASVLAACGNDDGTTDTEPAAQPTTEEDMGAATVDTADSELGTILVDAEGITLYRFEMDTDGSSTCYDDCESSWPPLVADDPTAGGEADQGLLGTTERDDGTVQVTYDDQPLYYFSGDSAPGDTKGQNLGKVWFVVAPDGDAIETKGAGSEDDGGMTDDDDMTDDDMTDDGSGEDDNGYDR